jgi:hypothetical protein
MARSTQGRLHEAMSHGYLAGKHLTAEGHTRQEQNYISLPDFTNNYF